MHAPIRLTRRGHDVLARIRTRALHDALRDPEQLPAMEAVLTGLLISVTGGDALMRDVLAQLVDREGNVTALPADRLIRLACEVLARQSTVTPEHRRNTCTYSPAYYARAEWIGALMDADYRMPRLDIEEIFAEMSGAELRELSSAVAATHGTPPAKVSELRAWLIGKLPDWQPVSFHADGPPREAFRVMEEA